MSAFLVTAGAQDAKGKAANPALLASKRLLFR
jgi:hypothetical protein